MARVVLENLLKLYPDKTGEPVRAVDEIDLEINDREFMVLVGPSGCGKSTTLRMIAGLEEITGGTIAIDGKVVNEVQPKNRDIAMVFQNYALYPHMSVYDNMAFGLKLRSLPKPQIQERVAMAADILGIENLLKRKPKALSGGQRQRVAVGRAIVRDPKVFLFDEPLSNLDAKMRVSTRTEISKLHARLNATMIYVTHDQTEAMTMGDRICVMKDGKIMQVAEPLELYHNPSNMFVAGFIGSPPMNFLHGTLMADSAGLRFVEKVESTNGGSRPVEVHLNQRMERVARGYEGKPIVLGVRPEDIDDKGPETNGNQKAFPATIEVSEPMGSETFLYVRTAGHAVIAKIDGHTDYKFGSMTNLTFDLTNAHLFDPDSGDVLR